MVQTSIIFAMAVVVVAVSSMELQPTLLERSILKETIERGGSMSAYEDFEVEDVQRDSGETNDIIDIAETLTRKVSKVISGLSFVSDVMSGIKLLASFFRTTYTSEDNQHYWERLNETAVALVDEILDDTIIKETNDAVDRLSEDLQLYIDTNSTEGDLSALELSLHMDDELNNIISLYSGISHVEKIALHYLDMATTRLSLWHATSLRYIEEFSLEGEIPSGGSVCDIIMKWDMAMNTEVNEITTKLRPALDKWNSDFRDQLSMDCDANKHSPAFKQWREEIDCTIFDGYHGKNAQTWHTTCHHKDDPKCSKTEKICFDFCSYSNLYSHIGDNNNNYNTIVNHLNEMIANFFVVQRSQIDLFKEECDQSSEDE